MLEFGTTMSYEEMVLLTAVQTYGKESQCRMVMEECAELIQATNKMMRDDADVNNLILEISHVQIMIHQLQIMFDIDYDDIDRIKCLEVIRLDEKIHKERL